MIYRVEIRKDGSVVSCEPVELALNDGKFVSYVDAVDKTEAIKKAKKGWDSWRTQGVAKRNAALAAGLCTFCYRNATIPETTWCLECRAKEKIARRERTAIAKMPAVKRIDVIKERSARISETRSQAAKKGNAVAMIAKCKAADDRWESSGEVFNGPIRSALRRVLSAYDRDPANFRAWLLSKLGQSEQTAAE